MAEKTEAFLKKMIQHLFQILEIEAKAEITKDKEGLVIVQIQTEEPGLLIGYHGRTLAGLQRIFSLMAYRQAGEWARLIVNVNDYREKRREALERMALSIAQRVKFSGEAQALPPMSSFERRIVHLILAEDSEVETDSEGEGSQRRVVVRPKSRSGDDLPARLDSAKRVGEVRK